MNESFTSWLAGAAALAAVGCSSEEPAPPPDFDATAAALANDGVLPAGARFVDAIVALDDAIGTLCGGNPPDATAVETSRERWREASRVWNRYAIYDFGPMSDGIPTPADAFIDSFKAFRQGESHVETLRTELRTIVADGTDLSGDDFTARTYQRVGLVALEVALFETAVEPPDPAAAAVADELSASPNKCTYLEKQSEVLRDRAVALDAAWRPDGGDYLATYLSSTSDALGAVLTAVQGHLEYLERRSIANRGAPISGISYENIDATMDELEVLLNAGDADSLASRLEQAQAQAVRDDHATRIAAARAAIGAEDPDALGPELVALGTIHLNDIPQALGITLGLNFTDGD